MLIQKNRLIAISTPLGEDEVALYTADIVEELSQPFTFNVELLSENHNIPLDDLIGKNVTIRLGSSDDLRYFNGFVTEFYQLPNSDKFSRYGATIRPWLWLLSLSENCRIFQEKSYPEIIKEVFDELNFSDYEIQLTGAYPALDYVVQYNESDYNFVSRLMEQEGIFYFFKHEDGKHTLIIADDNSTLPDSGDIPFYQADFASKEITIEGVSNWENYRRVVTGGMRLSDFDFEVPTKNLETVSSDPKATAVSSFEKYSYPGKYIERDKGSDYTRLLMEKENVAYETKAAQSNVQSLYAGSHFSLTDHYRADQNSKYLITHYRCFLKSDEYLSALDSDDSEVFSSEFTAIPSKVAFRPQQKAMKPKMIGPQTAKVVGKAGEEIWTDKYGRVKVHFHWDRYDQSNEKSSCWIRVAQTWAGKKWGQIQIPRIGQEVLIEFLGGDPDRPIIIGSVYNGSTMPPYDLPANATQSGIKTRSTKGGNPDNFNEIRFEDKKGSEELYIHAEKDQTTMTENDHNDTVGRNRMIDVGVNHVENIGQAMTITVGNTKTEQVNVNSNETVGAAKTVNVGGALVLSVGGASAEIVGAAKSENVGLTRSVNVAVNDSLNVGGDVSIDVSKNRSISVGKDQDVKVAGKHIEEIAKEYGVTAKEINLTAKDKITLKVGKASIVMMKNGDITIKGKKINVKGSGDIVMKGSKIKEN